MKLWPFNRGHSGERQSAPPSLADSARILAEYRCLSQRERIRARARLMREQMGLPPLDALNPRGN